MSKELSYEDILKNNGVNIEEVNPTYVKDQEIAKQTTIKDIGAVDKQYVQDTQKAVDSRTTTNPLALGMAVTGKLSKMTTMGAAGLAQQVQNTAIDVVDFIDNKAASLGVTSHEYITNPEKYKGHYADEMQVTASIDEKVGAAIVQFGAPMAGMLKMGMVAGAVADTAYNFITADPHQKNLANSLLEHAPSLRKLPMAYYVADALAHKTGDTSMETRVKDTLLNTGIGGATVGALYGALKLGQAGKRIISGLSKKQAGVAQAAEAVASAETGAMKVAPQSVNEAELATKEAAMGENLTEAAPTTGVAGVPDAPPIVAKATTQAEVPPIVDSTKEDAVLSQILHGEDGEAERSRLAKAYGKVETQYVPTTDPEMLAKADAIINDPAKRESLITKVENWKQGDTQLLGEENVAAHQIMIEGHKSAQTYIAKAVLSNDPNDEAIALEHLYSALRVDEVRGGSASQVGHTLRSQQVIEEMTNMPISEVAKSLDLENKQELIKMFHASHGTPADQKATLQAVHHIYQLHPDEASAMIAKAQRESGGKTSAFVDGLISTSMNSFLSFKSAGVALSQMGIFATKQTADTYLAALIGRGTDSVTFAQANAKASAQILSTFEALGNGWQTLKTGRTAGPTKLVDRIPEAHVTGSNIVPDKDSAALTGLRTAVDAFGAIQSAPGRLIKTADAIGGTTIYRGSIAEHAQSGLEKMLREGTVMPVEKQAAYIRKFNEDPPKWAHDLAIEEVRRAGGTQKLTSENTFLPVVGTISELTRSGLQKLPVMNVVTPFTNLGFNLAQEVVRSSPLALVAIASNSNTRKMMMSGSREAQIAWANVATGSSIVGLGAYLSMNGMYTGKKTENYAVKAALDEKSKNEAEHILKVGGVNIDMSKQDYLRSMLDVGHAMAQASGYLTREQYQEAATILAISVADTFDPAAMKENVGGLFSDISDVLDGKNTSKIIAKYVSRPLPMQGMLKNINQSLGIDTHMHTEFVNKANTNPVTRALGAIMDTYKSKVPFWSRDMSSGRNILGYYRNAPTGMDLGMVSQFYASNEQGSKVLSQLRKLSAYDGVYKDEGVPPYTLGVNVPGDVLEYQGKSIQLTPKEHDDLQVLVAGYVPAKEFGGKPTMFAPMNLESALGEVFGAFKDHFGEDKTIEKAAFKAIITKTHKVMTQYRGNGIKKFIEQHPEVAEKLGILSAEQLDPVFNPINF